MKALRTMIACVGAATFVFASGCVTASGGGGGGGGTTGAFPLNGEYQAVYDQGLAPDCFDISSNTVIEYRQDCGQNILAAPTDLVTVNDTLVFVFQNLTYVFSRAGGDIRVSLDNNGTIIGSGRLLRQ